MLKNLYGQVYTNNKIKNIRLLSSGVNASFLMDKVVALLTKTNMRLFGALTISFMLGLLLGFTSIIYLYDLEIPPTKVTTNNAGDVLITEKNVNNDSSKAVALMQTPEWAKNINTVMEANKRLTESMTRDALRQIREYKQQQEAAAINQPKPVASLTDYLTPAQKAELERDVM